ncbi:hypothetical protein ALC62_08377 [Cyphomyrmex costatus]|uniref:Dachshund like protein 1 n=1 Tax=Cyphomyrmex costatus TaxID=456900 RepID=A0A151IH18_9HYME|nr:hypothetical protein ALC62_08377 [Cyphomyrmex costatus]
MLRDHVKSIDPGGTERKFATQITGPDYCNAGRRAAEADGSGTWAPDLILNEDEGKGRTRDDVSFDLDEEEEEEDEEMKKERMQKRYEEQILDCVQEEWEEVEVTIVAYEEVERRGRTLRMRREDSVFVCSSVVKYLCISIHSALSDRSIKKNGGKGKREKWNTVKRRRSKEVWILMASNSLSSVLSRLNRRWKLPRWLPACLLAGLRCSPEREKRGGGEEASIQSGDETPGRRFTLLPLSQSVFDVPRMEKSPLLANGYNHPPTHLSHMQFMQLGGHPGAGHTAILSPASLPHHLQAQAQARAEQGLKVNPNMTNMEALARSGTVWENCRAAYEDIVKHLERLREERGDAERALALDHKPRDLSSHNGSSNGHSPVLNLSKTAGSGSVGEQSGSEAGASHRSQDDDEEDDNLSEDLEDDNEKDEDLSDVPENLPLPAPGSESPPQALNYSQIASAAVAVSQSAQDPSVSSTETLLRNIQGLLKVAADNARQQERQINYEKARNARRGAARRLLLVGLTDFARAFDAKISMQRESIDRPGKGVVEDKGCCGMERGKKKKESSGSQRRRRRRLRRRGQRGREGSSRKESKRGPI